MRRYYDLNALVLNATDSGDYPEYPVLADGARSVGIYGNFDGAIVQIVLFTEGPDGMKELPVGLGLTYTEAEEPSIYDFPDGMPCKVRVVNAGASTNISVNLHSVQ